MINIEKYIKIPFMSHGRDFNGCDCYGLVRLVIQEETGKILPDFWDYSSANEIEIVSNLININRPNIPNIKKEKPDEMDIVLYKFKGYVSHMAVYVGNGRILHIISNTNANCVPVEHGILKGRVEGYYGIQ